MSYRTEPPIGRQAMFEIDNLVRGYDTARMRLRAFCEEPELELMVQVRRESRNQPRDECFPSPEVCRTITGICKEFLLGEMQVYRTKLAEFGVDPEAP